MFVASPSVPISIVPLLPMPAPRVFEKFPEIITLVSALVISFPTDPAFKASKVYFSPSGTLKTPSCLSSGRGVPSCVVQLNGAPPSIRFASLYLASPLCTPKNLFE